MQKTFKEPPPYMQVYRLAQGNAASKVAHNVSRGAFKVLKDTYGFNARFNAYHNLYQRLRNLGVLEGLTRDLE